MSRKIGALAVLVATVMLTVGFAGCIDEGDEVDWTTPTSIDFDDITIYETNETIEITISLMDKKDEFTRASGTLRIALFDSDDFEMMNKTYEVKAKDFFGVSILGIKLSSYSMEIPFADVTKSHDRGYDIMTDNVMHGMAWFTHKDDTFMDLYDAGLFNPTIPEALLHPNEAPEAGMTVDNPGFVGMVVTVNASTSTDLEGGHFDYEWDWGDGDSVPSIIATEEESHVYDAAGTYTIILKVIDPEDAEDTVSMDVTIDWALDITINSWGVVADGDHAGDTYVEILVDNAAPADVTTPTSGAGGILLKDAAEDFTENNGTDVAIPTTIAMDGDATFMVYFDPAEGFTPTQVDVWGRMFPLP